MEQVQVTTCKYHFRVLLSKSPGMRAKNLFREGLGNAVIWSSHLRDQLQAQLHATLSAADRALFPTTQEPASEDPAAEVPDASEAVEATDVLEAAEAANASGTSEVMVADEGDHSQHPKFSAMQEQMLTVAAVCSTDTGIPQKQVLQWFHASQNKPNVRCPHWWNLYQGYANHKMNRTTEIRHTWLGADMNLDAEIHPLTMSELKEAYPVFIKACGGSDKSEEILLKYAEWASAEGVTTYEGCQHRFLAVQQRLDSTIGKIEAQDDFQVIYFIGGPHCHQDSQLTGLSHTSGLSEFFNKLNNSEDQVLTALKSAMYDSELKKLHDLKARDGTPNASTTSSALSTSSAGASSSKLVPIKFEHSTSPQPHVKHDYSGMTQAKITAARRQLAATHHTKAKNANVALQDHMRAMSISDTLDSIDLFKGNGFKWTGIPQLLGSKHLQIERYPGGEPGAEVRFPMDETSTKAASGWRMMERNSLNQALDPCGTRGEGMQIVQHQYKLGGMVIFSLDYLLKVLPHNSPDYVCHYLANMADYWTGTCLDGDVPLDHEEEEVDQLVCYVLLNSSHWSCKDPHSYRGGTGSWQKVDAYLPGSLFGLPATEKVACQCHDASWIVMPRGNLLKSNWELVTFRMPPGWGRFVRSISRLNCKATLITGDNYCDMPLAPDSVPHSVLGILDHINQDILLKGMSGEQITKEADDVGLCPRVISVHTGQEGKALCHKCSHYSVLVMFCPWESLHPEVARMPVIVPKNVPRMHPDLPQNKLTQSVVELYKECVRKVGIGAALLKVDKG
ncbi:hypothetical protein B0H14DRAFT_2638512 [Mycena olivaceomarginata]|nr:hypothetical protein B0H14DRAFT_2638512 [Mycena olivaceomarginata]